nr:hypothetical protein [Streptomyces sp. Alain-F2R5]
MVAAATGSVLLTAPAQAEEPGDPGARIAPRMTHGLDKSTREGTPAEAARAHLKEHQDTYLVPAEDLATERTTKSGDQSSVRFQQKHRGVPVFGAEYAVQTEAAGAGRQRVTSATGTLFPELTVSTTPKVTEATARQRMQSLDPSPASTAREPRHTA